MRIPQYWKRSTFNGLDKDGKPVEFAAWGWSDESSEDALQRGAERAKSGFLRFANGTLRERSAQAATDYDYADVPPREEILERISDSTVSDTTTESNPAAIITRNRYGALVLNSSHIFFVDIDLPPIPRPPNVVEAIKRALSKAYREKLALERHYAAITRISDWSSKNPSYGFRIYQTKAGFRLLFTNKRFDPQSAEVKRIFQELHSDPLYQRLTQKQKSFRARLTPKPWRIGLPRPSSLHPRDAQQQEAYLSWLIRYVEKSASYSTCTLIDKIGHASIDDALIQDIITLHDKECKSESSLPLA